MKRLLKVLFIVVVVILAVILLLPTVAGGWIKSKVQSTIAESMEADVTIDSMSFGWFSGLEMDGLKIDGRDPHATDVELAHLEAQPSILSLLGGKLDIADGRANGIVITTSSGGATSSNAKTEPTELPIDLDVNIAVEDITVIHKDPTWTKPLAIRKLERLTAHLTKKDGLKFTVKDGPLTLEGGAEIFADNRVLDATKMKIDATLKAKDQALSRFAELLAPWFTISAGQLDADQKFLVRDGKIVMKGTMNFAGLSLTEADRDVQHHFESIRFDSDLDAKNDLEGSGTMGLVMRKGRSEGLEGIDGPLLIGDVDILAKLQPGKNLLVQKATIQGDLIQMEASGNIALGGDLPRGDFRMRIDSALDKLGRFAANRSDLAGAMHSEVDVKSLADGTLELRGGTTIRNLRADSPFQGVPPINEKELRLTHDLDLKDRALTIKKFKLESGFASAEANGALDLGEGDRGPSGRVTFSADAALDQLMALVGDLVPAELRGRINANGTIDAKGEVTRFNTRLKTNRLRVTHESLGESPFNVGTLDMTIDGDYAASAEQLDVKSLSIKGDLADLNGTLQQNGKAESLALNLKGRVNLDQLATPFVERKPNSSFRNSQVDLALGKNKDVIQLSRAVITAGKSRMEASSPSIRLGEAGPSGEVAYSFKGLLEDLQPFMEALEKPLFAKGQVDVSGVYGLGQAKRLGAKGTARNIVMSGEMLSGRSVSIRDGNFDIATRGGGEQPLSLDKIKARLVGFRQSKPGSTELGGDFDMDGSLKGDGNFTMNATGTNLRLRDSETNKITTINKPLIARAQGRLDEAKGIYDITSLSIDAEGMKATGRGTYDPARRFTVDLNSDIDNATFARNWLALAFDDVDGKGKGRIELDADIPMGNNSDGAQSQGRLVARMDEVMVEGIRFRTLDIAGNLVNGIGKLDKGDATINGGPAKLTAEVDLTQAKNMYKFGVDAKNVKVEKRMQPVIARVIPIFAGVGVGVETTIDLDLNVDGNGSDFDSILNTLNGVGSFASQGGSVTGGPILTGVMGLLRLPPRLDFNALQTNIAVKNGAIHQDGLTIGGNLMDIRLSGSTAFSGKLDYALGLKPRPGKVDGWDRFGGLISSDGFLPLGLGGTVSSPTPKLPKPEDLLKGAAGNIIGGLLGGKKADGSKSNNPLDGLLGGKKDGDQPKNPLDSLLGGRKKKDESKPQNPLDRLLGGKKGEDEEKEKKPNPLERLLGGGR